MQPISLDQALTVFLTSLRARNTSVLTQQAYATDVAQFITWLKETTVVATHAGLVTKADIIEYLSYLSDLGWMGVTRARKLASLREFFRYLQESELIPLLPCCECSHSQKRAQSASLFTP